MATNTLPVTITPGYEIADGEKATNAKFRLMANPTGVVNLLPSQIAAALSAVPAGSSIASTDFINGIFIDGVGTVGSTNFTSLTATFSANDNGELIFGSGIQPGSTITFVDGITTTLSAPYLVQYSDGVTNGTTTLTSATANFVSADAGRTIVQPSNTNILAGTTISSVTDTHTVILSQAASGSATGVVFQVNGRMNTALTFGISGRAKGWNLSVDTNGNGTLQTAFLFGTLGLISGTFEIDRSGNLSVGSGANLLRATAAGDFVWGQAPTSSTLDHNGNYFAGATALANAIFSIGASGNVSAMNAQSVLHNCPTDMINPALQPLTMSPSGGSIINPTNLSINCPTRYSRIYYRPSIPAGIAVHNSTDFNTTGTGQYGFENYDVGKTIVINGLTNRVVDYISNTEITLGGPYSGTSASNLDYYLIPDISDLLYTGPITLTITQRITAIGYKQGEYSAYNTQLFGLNSTIVTNPIFSPIGATYTGSSKVITLSDIYSGSSIFYTIDGTSPTHSSGTPTGTTVLLATNPGNITLRLGTTVVKALGYKAGSTDSQEVDATYIVTAASNAGGGDPTDTGGGGGGKYAP